MVLVLAFAALLVIAAIQVWQYATRGEHSAFTTSNFGTYEKTSLVIQVGIVVFRGIQAVIELLSGKRISAWSAKPSTSSASTSSTTSFGRSLGDD